MKKLLMLLFVFSLMFSLVVAQDSPDLGVGGEEVEKIKGVVEDFSPLDEEGKVNLSKYAPFKSKAEERVEKINLWLKDNASWLSAIFGMVPSLSVLFAINLFWILLLLVVLVFNANSVFGFFEVLSKEIDLMFFETHWSNVFGFLVFVTLLITKTIVLMAEFGEELFDIFWNYVLPWGIPIAVILVIFVIVILVLLVIYARPFLMVIGKGLAKKKEAKGQEEEAANREAIKIVVDKITGE